MAASFGTRTVPAPDTSVVTIDLDPGEYFMIPLALGVQNGTFPLGWNYLNITVQHSLSGGPSTGNLTQISTEGLEMGLCAGTTYAPTHSSFYGIGMKITGTLTGYAPSGTNIRFYKNPWNTFYRTGGSDTTGGNTGIAHFARDESASTYPNLYVWGFRHYTTNHWILTGWDMFGVEAWIPLATRKMMAMTGVWNPRDHVNLYFNTELGIGVRANNPSSANLYPTDSSVANCDTIWFRNFMSTGIKWRIMVPSVHREHNTAAGA